MNNVTDGLPADAGGSGSVIPAPAAAVPQRTREQHNYKVQRSRNGGETDPQLERSGGETDAQHERSGEVVDLPAVSRALATLDLSLAQHGAPDPERTAAWLCALGAGGRA